MCKMSIYNTFVRRYNKYRILYYREVFMNIKKLLALLLSVFTIAALICGCADQNDVSDDLSSSIDGSGNSSDVSSGISGDTSSDASSDIPSDDPSTDPSNDTSSSEPLDPMAEYQKYLELFVEHYNNCQKILYQQLSYDENDYIEAPCYYIAEENGNQVLKSKKYKYYRVTEENYSYTGNLIRYIAKYNADCADWLCKIFDDDDPGNGVPPMYIDGPYNKLYMADPAYRWEHVAWAQSKYSLARLTAEYSYFEVEGDRVYYYMSAEIITEDETRNRKFFKTIKTKELKYYLPDGMSAYDRQPQNPDEDELRELLEYFIDSENESMRMFKGNSYYDINDSIEFVKDYMWWGDKLVIDKQKYYRLTIDDINSIRDLIDYRSRNRLDKSSAAESFFYDGDDQPYFIETERGLYMMFDEEPDPSAPVQINTYDIERSKIEIKDGIMYITTRYNIPPEYSEGDIVLKYKYCDGRWRSF